MIGLVVGLLAVYALGYVVVRADHRLVRHASGCVVRGSLEGHARDLWRWPWTCADLRRTLAPAETVEIVFAPPVAFEELVRGPHRSRPTICDLPPAPLGLPSEGLWRPGWCPTLSSKAP